MLCHFGWALGSRPWMISRRRCWWRCRASSADSCTGAERRRGWEGEWGRKFPIEEIPSGQRCWGSTRLAKGSSLSRGRIWMFCRFQWEVPPKDPNNTGTFKMIIVWKALVITYLGAYDRPVQNRVGTFPLAPFSGMKPSFWRLLGGLRAVTESGCKKYWWKVIMSLKRSLFGCFSGGTDQVKTWYYFLLLLIFWAYFSW